MREIRTLRATWRGLETWCGSGPRATPARQPSTLLMSGDGKRSALERAPPRLSSTLLKRQKNDATDAEAICEAVTRANMRFVPTKTSGQQSGLLLHRARHLFIRQQTSVINAIRAHLAEFGIVAPVGRHGVEELLNVVADPNDKRVPEIARACLSAFGAQLRRIKEQVLEFDRLIRAWHRSNELSMRLDEAPGVGPVLATALVAAVADPKSFRSGRNFSAWIGLVPKQHSSGGKNRLGNISKQGDRYLRGFSWPARSLSSVTPKFMAPHIGRGSRLCWHGGLPRLRLSRSPTRSPEWSGP